MNSDRTVPLSPVTIVGWALRPLPLAGLQPLLALSAGFLERRHPEIIDRLASGGDLRIAVDPTDLPFCLLIAVTPSGLQIRAIGDGRRSDGQSGASARITGPLAALIRLLEGKEDGDALFFSRDLTVIGDMEAVVAVRNALDGAGIDLLEDMLGAMGALSRPARRIFKTVQQIVRRAAADLSAVGDAINEPSRRRMDAQDSAIRSLHRRLDEIDAERRDRRVERE